MANDIKYLWELRMNHHADVTNAFIHLFQHIELTPEKMTFLVAEFGRCFDRPAFWGKMQEKAIPFPIEREKFREEFYFALSQSMIKQS